ncbi:NAD-dependent epimerase/dehydratase [Reticulomyxa filosa]|uniref:NAD-dependent epimerase/dehydratase n=1 Tax=Reticulomyxa filosa TaxID=46433 RepID=X6M5M5_RETFI|nr:NAD-dependent epimerase/dehydratase [Reticulomyxa filosa]|eukprot:ETO08772.1 NAD-dependent epimerase/dehydratase [Reticulomyxa filosa]
MNNPPLVLVTGASGFIAGHVVQQLCIKGYRVRGTVRKISKDHQYIYDLSTDKNTRPIELFECDLSSDKNWDNAIQGCDYVIHTANVMPPAKGEKNLTEKDYTEPVMKGMERILNVCLANRNTIKRVVYTTSVAAMDVEGKNLPKERQEVTFLTSKDWTPLDKPDYFVN